MSRLLSSQSDDDGGRVGEGDLPNHVGPSRKRRALQVQEEKNATKEALNGTAFAQFFFGPGGRQTGAVFLAFRIPRDDRNSAQGRMNPGDEVQPPIGGIQTDHPWADVIQMDRPGQKWLREGSIMDISRRQEKKERQSRTTANQGMDAIA